MFLAALHWPAESNRCGLVSQYVVNTESYLAFLTVLSPFLGGSGSPNMLIEVSYNMVDWMELIGSFTWQVLS